MKKTFINSYRHSSFEGVEVIKEITRRKNMPLMAVMPIVFTSLLFKDKSYDRIFEIGRLTDAVSKTPQVIIDCQAEENSGQLIVTWDYAEEYIDRKTILKMQEQMKKILLLASDEKDISPAFALPDDDLQIWKKYNDTDVRTDKTSLIELFMHSAEKYPDRRAVSIGDLSYTYSELNELSAARAVELTKNGAVSGSNIAVTARRNMDTIVNILAVLRIGAAYVPVAADAGRERIRYIINNSGCELALDDSVIKISAHAHESEINDRTAGDVSSELAPVRAAGFHSDIGHSNTDSLKNFSGSRAYIIYTSGTTGKPKGVSIANESAANTILDMNDRLEVTEDDRFIGISSLTFDLSVYDIFGAFCAGAELVLVPDSRNPELLKKIVREKSITIWNSVPSFVKLFLMSVKQGDVFKSVRHIMMSGDWIPVQLPEQIAAHFINTDILSLGGATEASIWSIYYPVRSTDKNWKSIPYGYPLANQKIYVMDRNMKLCPVSVPGEICIGGTGLAIGYCNDPEKTSDAFVMTEEFGRLYKTGDSGVLSPEGYVRIIGRIDFQMKINGFRIEAGEIESVACRYSDKINSAVAVPLHENTQLCLALETEENVNKTEFCRFLSEYLPPYMIASQIICLKKMPLTANGKISRKDIIRQAEHRISAAAVKPETELERQIYEIWKQVLNRSDFGIRDSFFELGGDSLKAAEVYYRLEEQGIKLEISKLFMFSTIEQLAYEIEQLDYSNELISGETGEI